MLLISVAIPGMKIVGDENSARVVTCLTEISGK
jgi:hypothetical protein